MSKKFWGLFLTLCLAFGLSAILFASDSYEYENVILFEELVQNDDFTTSIREYLISQYGEAFVQNHSEAIRTHSEMMNNLPKSRTGEVINPDSFGGFYIDDNGNLVILTVASKDDAYEDIFPDSRNVGSRTVQFSYNELNNIIDILAEMIEDDDERERIFSIADSIALDIVGNRVEVRLIEYSQEQIELFRNTVFDSPALFFMQSFGRFTISEYR